MRTTAASTVCPAQFTVHPVAPAGTTVVAAGTMVAPAGITAATAGRAVASGRSLPRAAKCPITQPNLNRCPVSYDTILLPTYLLRS